MDHLPKGDLKTLDNLALYLQEIMSLPKEKKLIVDPKMKLIGTDIKRSLAELLQGPENFLRGEIDLPNMDDPKSIKSFLYRMQGGGRAGRDMLNKAPKGLDKLFNQHHVAGLMEMMPNYAGKSAKEARDISREIYELTGVMPGSHGGNLVEISADRSIHLGIAHGGSYKGIDISADTRSQQLINTGAAIRLNVNRAIEAQDATKPLYNLGQELIILGGGNPKTNYFLDNTLDAETSKLARMYFSKGMNSKYGKVLTAPEFLQESGITFNAGMGITQDQFDAGMRKLTKGIKNNYKPAIKGVGAEVLAAAFLSNMTGETESIGESLYAGATTLIPDSGAAGSETVDVEGNTYQYDRSTNMVYGMDLGRKVQGLAFKNGQAKLVPYGSLEGRTSVMEDLTNPLKAMSTAIGDTYKRREEEAKNKLSTTTFNQF